MSQTTSSPGAISRSEGSACGSAPFGPAATIAGNEGSAPSSRIARVRGAARPRARCAPRARPRAPTRRRRRRSGRPRRSPRSRPSSLRRRSRSTSPPAGDQLDPLAELLLELAPGWRRWSRCRRSRPGPRRREASSGSSRLGGGDPLEGVADLLLGPLGVAEVGDEDARVSAPTTPRALVPVKPVSQRDVGDRVARPSRPDGPGRRRSAGRGPPRPPGLASRSARAALTPPSLSASAARALRGSRRLPCRRSRAITRPSSTEWRRHSSRCVDVREVDLDRRQPGESRARRGSPTVVGPGAGVEHRAVGDLGQAMQALDVVALVVGLKERRPRGRARARSA